MSLNDILLNGPIMIEMYGKHLIDTDQQVGKVQIRKAAVILNAPTENHFDYKKLLVSILSACNLSLEEIELIDSSKWEDPGTLEASLQGGPEKVLMFGNISGSEKEEDTNYFRESMKYGKNTLQVPSLSKIAEDKQLKLKLWNSLRAYLNIREK